MLLDQLVYGYDEGHRLLVGSRKMSARSHTRLMSATDVDPGSDDGFVVTGLPLPEDRMYALCFTWRAPEVSRPGSVWSHVVLLASDHLRHLNDPYEVAQAAKRPSPFTIDAYRERLTLRHFLDTPQPSDMALERVLVAMRSEVKTHAISNDLEDAAKALGYVWGLQWPALRSRFAFRTRNIARASSSGEVQIARKIRDGVEQPLPIERQEAVLAAHVLRSRRSVLQRFFAQYGPGTTPRLQSFNALTDIYLAMEAHDAQWTRRLLEESFPTQKDAFNLKLDLFSDQSIVFREDLAVASLLQTQTEAWDAEALNITPRVVEHLLRHGVAATAPSLPLAPIKAVQRGFITFLQTHADLVDLLSAFEHRVDLLNDLDRTHITACSDIDQWARLTPAAARALLHHLPLSAEIAAAAITGLHGRAVTKEYGYASTFEVLLHRSDSSLCRQLLEQSAPNDLNWADLGTELALFLAQCWPNALPVAAQRATRDALVERREHQDARWLAAAAALLASGGTEADLSLLETFGPLHRALTENRMPAEGWASLDQVLPSDTDPARRLRRALLEVSRNYEWSAAEVGWALRDAGPYIEESLWPTKHAGDRIWKVVHKALVALGKAKGEGGN